jgi:heme-degrading monooxygenase HmoA
MYARLSTYVIPPDELEGQIQTAEEVQKRVTAMPGSLGLYYLVDRATGNTVSLTLWDTEQAMLDSVTAANRLREETTSGAAGEVISVASYEVVTKPNR